MGYPATEYGESVSPDRTLNVYHSQNSVSWDAPVCGQDLYDQPQLRYIHGDWMHTPWNPWGTGGCSVHVADPMSNALYHQLLLKEETDSAGNAFIEGRHQQGNVRTDGIMVNVSCVMTAEIQREREEQSTHGTVLQKCSSWSEAAQLSSSEGRSVSQNSSAAEICTGVMMVQEENSPCSTLVPGCPCAYDVPVSFEREICFAGANAMPAPFRLEQEIPLDQ